MGSKKLNPPPPDFDDDAPILPDELSKELRPASEWFAEQGIPMPVPRGRPPMERPKQSVTMRVDAEALDYFRSTGPGWQTRINELLVKEARKLRKPA